MWRILATRIEDRLNHSLHLWPAKPYFPLPFFLCVWLLSSSVKSMIPNHEGGFQQYQSANNDNVQFHGPESFKYQPISYLCKNNTKNCQQDQQDRRHLERSPTTGSFKAIVLLLDIVQDRPKPSVEDVLLLLNGPDNEDTTITPTGSVKTYFDVNSYGKYEIEFFVHEWTWPGKSEAECAGNNQGVYPGYADCWVESLDALEAKHKDFGDPFEWWDYDLDGDAYIDNIVILHNGYNGEIGADDEDGTPASQRIRSYAGFSFDGWKSPWSGIRVGYFATTSVYRGVKEQNIAYFNVLMHEFIHTFGMIDLYDTDFKGNGCGGYDIMAYPVGQANDAKNPGNTGPYTKIYMDWLTPIEIVNDGYYEMRPSLTSTDIYKISAGLPDDEYFLIENKHAIGWGKSAVFGAG